MPTRFYPGNIYHLYNRGNDRQRIFLEPENYRFFLNRLTHFFRIADTDLLAYCLLPNHYHLLVRLQNDTDFSNVLRRFITSYVKSFNKWHDRVGHVFQGSTRSKLVDDDRFLAHLCRYIHLNPVAAGLTKLPEEWKWSDYRQWVDENEESARPNVALRTTLFSTAEEYRRFVLEYSLELRKRYEAEKKIFELR
jgi:putative transposase